jgi:hypothetical protein
VGAFFDDMSGCGGQQWKTLGEYIFRQSRLVSLHRIVEAQFGAQVFCCVALRVRGESGRSGWWQLIGIIPLVGAIVLIVFFATEGERQPNAYGPDPKSVPGEVAVLS